eukprot:4024900-Amphidinium_carterae.1
MLPDSNDYYSNVQINCQVMLPDNNDYHNNDQTSYQDPSDVHPAKPLELLNIHGRLMATHSHACSIDSQHYQLCFKVERTSAKLPSAPRCHPAPHVPCSPVPSYSLPPLTMIHQHHSTRIAYMP